MADKTWVGGDGGGTGDYSTAANWSPSGVPSTDDNVRVPAGNEYAIDDGLDQSAVAIGDFIVEEGYAQTIGSSSGYLQIDPNRFEFHGSGQSYIDLGAANITAQVLGTVAAVVGERGLYLKGSDIDTLVVMGGSVGLAAVHGETSTVDTVRIAAATADVWLGEGCTLTTLEQTLGTGSLRCAATTITLHGGTLTTREEGTITTANVNGGTLYANATGAITTMVLNGGVADFTTSGADRTVTNLKLNPDARLNYDPNVLTITNWTTPDYPVRLTATNL